MTRTNAVVITLSRDEARALHELANDIEIGCSIVNDAGPRLRAAKRALLKLQQALSGRDAP